MADGGVYGFNYRTIIARGRAISVPPDASKNPTLGLKESPVFPAGTRDPARQRSKILTDVDRPHVRRCPTSLMIPAGTPFGSSYHGCS